MTVESKAAQQAQTMREDWNERARQDAFLYIASWKKDWDEDSFFASGEADYLALVDPVLQRLQFDPSCKSLPRLAHIDGQMVGRTWRGVSLTSSDVDQVARLAGASSTAFLGEKCPLAWCYGTKNR